MYNITNFIGLLNLEKCSAREVQMHTEILTEILKGIEHVRNLGMDEGTILGECWRNTI
jgi:hypothetical protein